MSRCSEADDNCGDHRLLRDDFYGEVAMDVRSIHLQTQDMNFFLSAYWVERGESDSRRWGGSDSSIGWMTAASSRGSESRGGAGGGGRGGGGREKGREGGGGGGGMRERRRRSRDGFQEHKARGVLRRLPPEKRLLRNKRT